LEIATAYGFSGCVIHVAKNTKKNSFTYEEAANNMYNNIVNAMSPELCPLLVETCSNQGTEIFFRFYELVHFALQVQKLHPSFGICIDTCHVFNSDVGYDPHYYLKYCLKNGVNVRLIHFNDSRTALGRHIDRHALAGTGHIPWTMLDETAKLATLYNIPCIVE
jgi:endonuclease IV